MAQPLFNKQERENLFTVPERTVSPPIAANRAHVEALVLGDPASYQSRKRVQLEGNVQDQVVQLLTSKYDTDRLKQAGIADPDSDLTPEQKTQAIQDFLKDEDLRGLRSRDALLMHYMKSGLGTVPQEIFERNFKLINATQIDALIKETTQQQRYRMRLEVDDLVASQGWNSYGEAFTEILVQDFIPVFNELSRLGLNTELLKAAGGTPKEGFKGWMPGEVRQQLRDHLTSLPPKEARQAVRNMANVVKELERHPTYGPLLTRYNVLEAFMETFTEGVFKGETGENKMDRYISNFSTALEGLFSVMAISKFGKGVRASYRASDALRARQLARVADQKKAVAQLDRQILDDAVGTEFGLDAGEAVAVHLPRPAQFVNDIDVLPEGSKDVLRASERTRSEILETTDGLTGRGLNPWDKSNAIKEAFDQIDLADGMAVHPKMSTLRALPNNTGFEIDAVIGETATGGWSSLDDAISDLLQLDPNLERFELVRVNEQGVLGPVFGDKSEFLRAAFKGEIPVSGAPVQTNLVPEYYLRYKQQRFWHTVDKQSFGSETFLNSGVVPRRILSPNAKFGDEIYGSFVRATMDQESLNRNFEIMFKPYYQLKAEDKRFVSGAYEWMEDFGKEFERAPEYSDILAKYDGITEAQLNGMIALRTGMDVLHELFNRRLYRDFQALGFKTARPSSPTLPTFHGTALSREQAKPGHYLDPEVGKVVRLSSQEIGEVYNAGGRVMKLDMAVDAANETKSKADQILLRGDQYEVGDLSTRPLKYHPGYSPRFYDDPYFIVKETQGVTLNGKLVKSAAPQVEAIKTAGSQLEAEGFMRRANKANVFRGRTDETFKVVRARDITQTENTLLQKQVLHREGRLFWDERNADRLPDVNGNRAKLEDPVQSLQRTVALAARQATHEDLLKGMKGAFENEFGDLVKKGRFDNATLGEIHAELKALRQNTVNKVEKDRISKAMELVGYFRLIEGTETAIIPIMREAAISVAATINRKTGLPTGKLEKYFQTMDPTRTVRSVAFHLFMILRPVRQALMQSAQISYLAGLKPSYVATPQFFKDAYALRQGVAQLRNSSYDTGMSVSKWAKQMGLKDAEYRKLVKEFNRSGLIDLVDVHSFAGGAKRFNKVALPESKAGVIGYKAKQFTEGTREFLQKWGFDFGERNNLTFTYNLALRRLMDDKKIKSVLDITPKQWDDLRVDASNLALAMVRPNNFWYQTGLTSVGTQFMSFGHKALLGLLAQNPAISKTDALRIVGATYLLFGANMFGSRDYVREQLKIMGLEEFGDREIAPGTGGTLVDLLSGGLVDTLFNSFWDLTVEDWKDIDTGFLAPGIDFSRMWDMQIETLAKQPWKVAFGPFGNIFSKALSSFEFIDWVKTGNPDLPATDKFALYANAAMSGLVPAYNDVWTSYMGYQMGLWYSASGEALPIRPTMNGLLARGLLGARTKEELAYYRLQNKAWESEEQIRELIRANKDHMTKVINMWAKGNMTKEAVRMNVQMLTNMMEEFPEGVRVRVLEASILEDLENGTPSVAKQIRTLFQNKNYTPDIGAMVDELIPDMPPEKRQQLVDFGNEMYKSRVKVDQEAKKILEEQQ